MHTDVYTYVCMYRCMYIHIYVYTYICICIDTMCVCIYICILIHKACVQVTTHVYHFKSVKVVKKRPSKRTKILVSTFKKIYF